MVMVVVDRRSTSRRMLESDDMGLVFASVDHNALNLANRVAGDEG
jgi:hypothetical protein